MIIPCSNDAVAIEKARELLDGRVLEIWVIGRRVAQLQPQKLPGERASCKPTRLSEVR